MWEMWDAQCEQAAMWRLRCGKCWVQRADKAWPVRQRVVAAGLGRCPVPHAACDMLCGKRGSAGEPPGVAVCRASCRGQLSGTAACGCSVAWVLGLCERAVNKSDNLTAGEVGAACC